MHVNSAPRRITRGPCDFVNQMNTSKDPNYCQQVTADDGALGDPEWDGILIELEQRESGQVLFLIFQCVSLSETRNICKARSLLGHQKPSNSSI